MQWSGGFRPIASRVISASRWDRATRPGSIVDMSGGRTTKVERQLLSLGFKFSTGMNDRTPLDVATAVNKFRYQHRDDPRIPDISFIRASVIPHLNTDKHATLPDRFVEAIKGIVWVKSDISEILQI